MFPKALGAREVKLREGGARVAVAPSPPGGALALALEPAKAVGASSRGRGGMGAGIGVLLLLLQLLVRVELEMQGELRPELGVTGVGWGAWRPRRAHLLASPQGCRIRTSCFQVRHPRCAFPSAGHQGQDVQGAISFHLSRVRSQEFVGLTRN